MSELKAYVVEDNATIRENLVGALEELTCVRVTASSGTEDEAQAWLREHPADWDLLIVDLFLKRGSGMGLVQHVARQRPTQKVVVFSNYVNASVRKRCARCVPVRLSSVVVHYPRSWQCATVQV